MKKMLFLAVFCMLLSGCKEDKNNNFNNLNINSIESYLNQIDVISDVCIVTEENDPNGQLNKQGGYIGALFFSHSSINNEVSSDSCKKGARGGGSIEIYANENDAKKRNDYLSTFDGSILADYHQIKGSIIVRISNELTASEQNKLYEKIISKIESTKN